MRKTRSISPEVESLASAIRFRWSCRRPRPPEESLTLWKYWSACDTATDEPAAPSVSGTPWSPADTVTFLTLVREELDRTNGAFLMGLEMAQWARTLGRSTNALYQYGKLIVGDIAWASLFHPEILSGGPSIYKRY